MNTESVVISKRLDRRRRRLRLLRRRKYFWAWLATCVGVRVFTKLREIPLQSPFPTFCNPKRNNLCSSSVHGTPNTNKINPTSSEINFYGFKAKQVRSKPYLWSWNLDRGKRVPFYRIQKKFYKFGHHFWN